MFLAKIVVTLRTSILDPQGKAVKHALESLALNEVHDARIGKFIELRIETNDRAHAERIVEEACKKLLANPVMEDYAFTLDNIA